MTETTFLAIVNAAVAVFTSIVAGAVVWLKAREAVVIGGKNTEGIAEVHGIVNSQREAMMKRIDNLEQLLQQSQDARHQMERHGDGGGTGTDIHGDTLRGGGS